MLTNLNFEQNIQHGLHWGQTEGGYGGQYSSTYFNLKCSSLPLDVLNTKIPQKSEIFFP